MGFAALHHPLQHRPFAEVLEWLDAAFEFPEALRVAFQDGAMFQAPECVLGGMSAWHCSYGHNTVRI